MPWVKIFISHSTKPDEAKKFLKAVQAALGKDFDLLLDHIVLKGGDNWREKIYQWLDEAHGAVLLLTKEALESKFVQMESTIVTWRKFRQPHFVLVPVIVGDVTYDDLDKGLFGEMALKTFQVISLKNPSQAREISQCFKKLKQLDSTRTPNEIYQARIIKLLKSDCKKEDLRDAGRAKLAWKDKDLQANTNYYEKFTCDILKASPADAFDAVKILKRAGMKSAPELLDLIAPSWVEEKRAKPVARLALGDNSERVISLNAAKTFTVHSYISKSSCMSLDHNFTRL